MSVIDNTTRDHPAKHGRAEHSRAKHGPAEHGDLLYRALFDRTNDGVFIYDLEGTTVAVNQEAVRLSGYSEEELIGRSFLDSAAPHERGQAEGIFSALLRGETVERYERVVRRKDASELVVEISASLVRDDNGDPHHVQSMVRNITERKAAEAALKESEERFRTLVENAPEAIVVLDAEKGHFVQANENALRLFKCRRDQLSSLDPVKLSPARQPDGRPAAEAAWQYVEMAKRGGTPVFEWMHQDLEGKRVPCEIRLVRLSTGHPNLIRGSMTDISERKRLEKEQYQLQAQMQQAQKLESLGVLAGGIAHDFNNLLVGVLGGATLAREELADDHPVQERLRQVELAATRASELTKQLLTYAGKSRFEKELVDLNALIPEVEELLGTAVSKRTKLRYQLARDPHFVLGDGSQLRQVVMNLITNASEAMGDIGGTVTVRLRREEADRAPVSDVGVGAGAKEGPYHVLEIIDEGPGIDEVARERIFEPFYSTKFAGRGLGLATVSAIVKRHRGILQVESLPRQGACFRALFPAAEKPIAHDEPARADAVDWRGSGTLLLVDDEPAVRQVIQDLLEHLGFQVVTARDGREAVARYRRHQSELVAVLLDNTMPEMDGPEAVLEMQRMGGKRVPIVMMSGYTEEGVVGRRGSASGIAEFIQKPVSLAVLRRTLHSVLS